MEPIKVDFSEGGRKKSVRSVLIPPEKAGIKILINIIVMLIAGAVTYYFMLPPMNPQDFKFYLFWIIVAAAYVISAFITSGAFKKPEYVPYVKKQSFVPGIVVGAVVLVLLVGYLISCPFFRAHSYAGILDLRSGDFKDTLSLIDSMSDFKNVPMIDSQTAETLADKTLGKFAEMGLESQFELLTEDSTQINYNGSPYRVYPLKYGDIFKWFLNSVTGREHEGIPGYVRVNMNTQKAELITDYDIKYSTAEHFSENLVRKLRFRHPTYIFGEISFEIDESGRPYWIVERIKKTIGLLGGEDVIGILKVDAETGEDKYYSNDEIKNDPGIAWVDQAFDADLLVKQYNYKGKYEGGFWNSLIGQSGVKKTSTGYSFLASGDDVYLYTGVTSVTGDNSILGFFLINQRTKDALFYSTAGATEQAAQESAQGKVQDMGWTASFPILLNIDGEATYFMSLKDSSNIVKSYAMVNVEQYNTVATPTRQDTNLRSCLEQYISDLKQLTPPVNIHFAYDSDSYTGEDVPGEDEPAQPTQNTVTGKITDLRSVAIDGSTYFYLELDGKGVYYYLAATLENGAVLLNAGDTVTVTVAAEAEGTQIPAISVKTEAQASGQAEEPSQPAEETSQPAEETSQPAEETSQPAEEQTSAAPQN